MMGKRFFVMAMLVTLLALAGCRSWCEHHGYYPAAPAAGYQPCCVPCCPCAPAPAGYTAPAPASSWTAPAPPPPPTCPAGCVPAH
jgi:hypothetical protein